MPRSNPRRFVLVSALAIALALAPTVVLAQQPVPTRAQLEAATYPVDVAPGGTATLIGGRFEAPAAPGSASKITASLQASANGMIGGQPAAAVVLASSGGGSGTFFDLYVVDAMVKTIARAALGDRIVLKALSVKATGRIVVSMVAHAPGEPQCCPTAAQTREYALQNGALTLVATTPTTGPAATPPRPATTGSGGLDATHDVTASGATILLGAVLTICLGARVATRSARPR